MDWTAEAIETLRALWAEGHSTAEIGRRMGISKNAVVGKAHRLNLPARPSPIRRDGEAVARTPAPRRTLLPVVRQPAAPPVVRQPAPQPAPVVRIAPPAPVAAAPVVRAFPRLSSRNCCWPLGEPGTKDFRFCDSGAIPGKPYCPEHAAVAYVKARDRREDAA